MTNDPLGVTISAREIYDQIVGLRDDVRSLTQSNEHVDRKLDDHEQRLRALEDLPEDTGERLTALERWKYGVPAAMLTGIGGVVTAFMKGTGKG